jgi:hypothetical protein
MGSLATPIPPRTARPIPYARRPCISGKAQAGNRYSQVGILPLRKQIQQNTLTVQLTSLSTLLPLHTTFFFSRLS